jgi:hypothetical protein
MRDFALLAGIIVLWIVLNRWVLPWFGVDTCMSGGCTTGCCPSYEPSPLGHDDKDVVQPKGDQ